jgi:hypothetical protein
LLDEFEGIFSRQKPDKYFRFIPSRDMKTPVQLDKLGIAWPTHSMQKDLVARVIDVMGQTCICFISFQKAQ